MKTLLLLLFSISTILQTIAQEGTDLETDAPKIILGINIPFGASIYIPNIYKKFGMYCTGFYNGASGIDDENYISAWHELTDDYIVNKRTLSIGATYRIWKPLQAYAGVGLGWGTRQLIYRDTPPVVFEDAYRTMADGIKPQFNVGLLLSYWRLAVGVGYDSYIQKPVYFIGYVIKVKKSEQKK